MSFTDSENEIFINADNKFEAYDKAVYELIPDQFNHPPYSAWVDSVTNKNGTIRKFNTFEGKAF
jgi:hypothetical protein